MRTPPSLLSCARSALWAAVSFAPMKIVQMKQMVNLLHMLSIIKLYKCANCIYRLMQVITSPGQVRAGRVRNAKLGVEKLIEEHLPSTLSEFILFETVL